MDVEGDSPAGELVLVAQPLHHLPVHHIRVSLLLAEREHRLVPNLSRWVVRIGEVEEDEDIRVENRGHPLEQGCQFELPAIRHGRCVDSSEHNSLLQFQVRLSFWVRLYRKGAFYLWTILSGVKPRVGADKSTAGASLLLTERKDKVGLWEHRKVVMIRKAVLMCLLNC